MEGFISQDAVEKMLCEYVEFEAYHTLSKKPVTQHVKLSIAAPL